MNGLAPPAPAADELEILRLCRAGDRRAFEVLYRAHARAAFGTAMLLLRDEALAADAVQAKNSPATCAAAT